MKRQSTISSFFTKKVVNKKPKLQHEADNSTTTTPMQVDPSPQAVSAPEESFSTPGLSKPKLSDQEKQALHERFAQKFGSMDKERSLKRQRVEQLMTDIDKQKEQIIPHQKFTPLETQVVELKAKYPGCLLLIEVGYKFRFFGEDAKVIKIPLHEIEQWFSNDTLLDCLPHFAHCKLY